MLIEVVNRIGERGRERIWNALIFQGFDACCAILSDLKSDTEPHPNISVL